MDPHIPPSISSFVIRFVVDSPSSEANQKYHGAIRHIQSDEEVSFNSWEDAVDFIRRYVPIESEPGLVDQ